MTSYICVILATYKRSTHFPNISTTQSLFIKCFHSLWLQKNHGQNHTVLCVIKSSFSIRPLAIMIWGSIPKKCISNSILYRSFIIFVTRTTPRHAIILIFSTDNC